MASPWRRWGGRGTLAMSRRGFCPREPKGAYAQDLWVGGRDPPDGRLPHERPPVSAGDP